VLWLQYVIKVMDVRRVREREAALQEAELLSQLEHPNIVRHQDSFMNPSHDQLCIVMQYCEGGDLSRR
jgi:NIMA (never in mitosis gene a)-related kinase